MAQTTENIEKMKDLAKIMSQFKGYNQCVDVYIEQSQATNYIRGKDVFEGIMPLCRQHYAIIKQVFASPDQVMSKFILNIYQLRIHQYVATKLVDDSKNDVRYLKTLHYLYVRTMKLSNDMKEFIKDSNDDLLSKLTQNMFSKHLSTYIDTELRCFDAICSGELRKFYDSKNHQKKQTERFQDLKRDMQAIISARTNINIVQIDNYGGETFLSEELAINLLQEASAAFERCSVLSKDVDTSTNIIKIADLLLKYLLTDHCDYAVDLGIQSIPIADTKSPPQIYFFDIVQKTNTIVHLLEKTYNANIIPYVRAMKYSDCIAKKRFCMSSIENKLDNGLDRALSSICNWVKIYLQSEQKKTDFKPESDIDTVASGACSTVCQYINQCIAQIKKTIDGENLTEVLQELGIRFHRVIYEHLQQYQYNTL